MVWILMIAGSCSPLWIFRGDKGINPYHGPQGKDLCRVTMIYGEKKETVTGLIDTGNRLREPVSSQPVHVAAAGVVKQLCPSVRVWSMCRTSP